MNHPLSNDWQELWKELEANHGNVGLDYVINPVLYPELAKAVRSHQHASIIDFGAGTHALAREFLLTDPKKDVSLLPIADINELRAKITTVIGLEGDPALVEKGETLLRETPGTEHLHLQYHVIREGVIAPFSDDSVEIAVSRQFMMHLSTLDLKHHLTDLTRILNADGTYICTILNPEYEQRKQLELNPDKSPLISHEAYNFSHGATGEYGSIPQYWRSLEDYNELFASHFDQIEYIPCFPITDRFKDSHPRYYQTDCPMAFVFILRKKSSMPTLAQLKQKSGATGFVSVLGKSTITSDSPEYQFTAAATQVVLEQNFGVIHGGYAGGAMSAVSDTATAYLQKNRLPAERNIGVPQLQHDGLWDRVEGAVFTEATDDIFDRLRLVTGGDIAIIAPLGGDGTELELTTLFHENVIRASQSTTKPTPIIFLQTPTGTNWKTHVQSKMNHLATSFKTFDQCPWMFFVDSLEEFRDAFVKAQSSLL